jgi:hypothetical protein
VTSTTAQDFDQLLQRYLAEAQGHIAKMAGFAFFVCLLPIAPLMLKIEFLWMLVFSSCRCPFCRQGLAIGASC